MDGSRSSCAGPLGMRVAPPGRRSDARAIERNAVRRRGPALCGRLAERERGMARRHARSLRRPCTDPAARAAGAGLERGRARAARRPVTLRAARAVRAPGRDPPMHYLAQWRMQAAARMLRDTKAPVAAIAQDVGYDSEAAFTRAFKRLWVGRPPPGGASEHGDPMFGRRRPPPPRRSPLRGGAALRPRSIA